MARKSKPAMVSQATVVITEVGGEVQCHSAPLFPLGDEVSVSMRLADSMVRMMMVFMEDQEGVTARLLGARGPVWADGPEGSE